MNIEQLYINHKLSFRPQSVELDGRELFHMNDDEAFSEFCKRIYKSFPQSYPKYFKMDTISRLAFLSSSLVLSEVDLDNYNKDNIAVLMANTSATIDTDNKFQESLSEIPSPSVFVYTLPNIMVGEICIRNGFKGENLFLINEDYDLEFLINNTRLLFQNSKTELCLTGWADYYSPEDFLIELMVISYTDKGYQL